MPWIVEQSSEISWERLETLMQQTASEAKQRLNARPRRVLLLPPDITRMHSGSGRLTEILYNLFAKEALVYVIPTLGQHTPHTPTENKQMFGSIPEDHILKHDWIGGCKSVGEISAEEVSKSCGGIADWPMPIILNSELVDRSWDLIINIGHVVPHEVLGFANHNKNYFIGLGGKDSICASHLMAAKCGIENNLGNLVTPVRHCFNLAEDRYLKHLPDLYVQVVMARNAQDELVHTGVFVGDDVETYLQAAKQSREQNITVFDEPIKKIVCVMQGDEFFSTWVANKAVYRTRMVLADGGELLVLAPGLKRFGEQEVVDRFIRKYGYIGTQRVMDLYEKQSDMQDWAHATAHLIHGSSEGRFRITYAPGHLTKEEIESVNFEYADLQEMMDRYRPQGRSQGWHRTEDGEEFYFIPTPSAGLWSTRDRLYNRPTGF